jgi:formylglycine-generating enzyme required for sulfatase activity
MKYEAKAYHSASQTIDADGCNEAGCTTANWGLANHIPASSSTGSPWRRISPTNASVECNSLNALNGVSNKYDLISNPEWMTIARNAEGVSSNFEAGVMARGWAASTLWGDTWTNTFVASSTGPECKYNIAADSCASTGNHLFRRTLALSNGEEIWDFSGNVWEWVDWSHTTAGLNLGPTTCRSSWEQFPDVLADTCYTDGALLSHQVFPATSNGSSLEAFGRFYGGSGGSARRGGMFADGTRSGIFALSLDTGTSTNAHTMGFRCVYRP